MVVRCSKYCRTEILVSEYFRYFLEMTFRLNYIFDFLVAQYIGSICMAVY